MRDTSLKFDWKKAVVSSRQDMNGDVGPALEMTWLGENSLGFLARLFGLAVSQIGATWRVERKS